MVPTFRCSLPPRELTGHIIRLGGGTMKRPWMPLYIGDYLADTAHFTVTESGAYLHLIMHYWVNGGLPTDEHQLRRIARLTSPQWRRSRSLLASKFDALWRHSRIDVELAQVIEISRKRSASARLLHSKCTASADTPTPTPTQKDSKSLKELVEKKGKPLHGRRTKDGMRVWIDRGTTEWNEYRENYKLANSGIEPTTQWNDSGAWFNYYGDWK